jgi:hypothetical protein
MTMVLICVLPAEATILEDHVVFIDVIAQAKTPKGETLLSLTARHVDKLLDVVRSRSVRGVPP